MSSVNIPFSEERHDNHRLAANILAVMVTDSLTNGGLPPPEVFKWFVEYATLQFIAHEHLAAHAGSEVTQEQIEQVETSEVLVKMLMKLLEKNQQFTLLHDVKKMLEVRRMSLPDSYQPAI